MRKKYVRNRKMAEAENLKAIQKEMKASDDLKTKTAGIDRLSLDGRGWGRG